MTLENKQEVNDVVYDWMKNPCLFPSSETKFKSKWLQPVHSLLASYLLSYAQLTVVFTKKRKLWQQQRQAHVSGHTIYSILIACGQD